MSSLPPLFLDPQALFAAVSALGLGEPYPSLDDVFSGGQHYVYKVSFLDHESLAVRVPIYTGIAGSISSTPKDVIDTVRHEERTLRTLEDAGFPWSPRCKGSSLTFENEIGSPFLVLTWAEGSQLHWDDSLPPHPLREKVLGEIAGIQASLIECTLKTSTTTASAFFERIAANRRTRVLEGKIPELTEQDCVDQASLLPRVLGKWGSDTMMAVDHGDIQPQNIIVDGEGNINGIIDWSFASFVPLLRAAGLPRFLWGEGGVPDPQVRADREVYIASFADIDSKAASYMKQVQGARDVDFRTLYVESLFSKGVHKLLAGKGWKIPGHELREDGDGEERGGGDEGGDNGRAEPGGGL